MVGGWGTWPGREYSLAVGFRPLHTLLYLRPRTPPPSLLTHSPKPGCPAPRAHVKMHLVKVNRVNAQKTHLLDGLGGACDSLNNQSIHLRNRRAIPWGPSGAGCGRHGTNSVQRSQSGEPWWPFLRLGSFLAWTDSRVCSVLSESLGAWSGKSQPHPASHTPGLLAASAEIPSDSPESLLGREWGPGSTF